MTTPPHRISSSGATGKTGRRVADRLEAARHRRPRAARAPAPRRSTGTDRSTWAAALDGVDAAYVAYVPDIAVPGARRRRRRASPSSPRGSASRRLVLLSGRGEPEALAAEHAFAAAAEAGGVDVDRRPRELVRAELQRGLLRRRRAQRRARAAGRRRARAVRRRRRHRRRRGRRAHRGRARRRRVYEVTGPRALTFDEAARQIGRRDSCAIPLAQVRSSLDALRAEERARRTRSTCSRYLFERDPRRAQRRDDRRRRAGARAAAALVRRLRARRPRARRTYVSAPVAG